MTVCACSLHDVLLVCCVLIVRYGILVLCTGFVVLGLVVLGLVLRFVVQGFVVREISVPLCAILTWHSRCTLCSNDRHGRLVLYSASDTAEQILRTLHRTMASGTPCLVRMMSLTDQGR